MDVKEGVIKPDHVPSIYCLCDWPWLMVSCWFSSALEKKNSLYFLSSVFYRMLSQCFWSYSYSTLRADLFNKWQDSAGDRPCQSGGEVLPISCWKCAQCKHSGQQGPTHCCGKALPIQQFHWFRSWCSTRRRRPVHSRTPLFCVS